MNSNTYKHKFSSVRIWIGCNNDVVYDVDCIIEHDIYPQKTHSCSVNIHGISIFVLKISGVYKEIYHRCYCVDILVVKR